MHRPRLTIIGIILITAGMAVISYLYYPAWSYYLLPAEIAYPSRLHPEQDTIHDSLPEDNRLVIGKIRVNINIVEGEDATALDHGAWREPQSAVPGEVGNVVISGHRFQIKPPSNRTFYLLDKINIGDEIIIYWQGEEYDYEVAEIFEIQPDQGEFIQKGEEEKLTIYTCTPLFSQARRLVILAEPIKHIEDKK